MEFLTQQPFCITIAAPRKSGKSFLIKQMLAGGFLKRFDYIIIMCPTLELNDDYDDYRNHEKVTLIAHVQNNDLTQLFDNAVAAQKQVMEHRRQQKRRNVNHALHESLEACETLVILDDCVDSGLFDFRGEADKIAERGRHLGLSCIISSQRISAVSRSVRINSDYFIIFVPYSAGELERFVEQFAFKHQRKALFNIIMEVFSVPYRFLMVDNTEKNIHDKLKMATAGEFMNNKLTVVSLT